jgi:cytochrome P450
VLEQRDRWSRLVDDPSLIPNAVEETLRYDPSAPVWRRVTTRPVTLGGVELPAGAKLFLWLAAAGRDREVFDDPDDFRLDRANAKRHLVFGNGIHFCLLGAWQTRSAARTGGAHAPLPPGTASSLHSRRSVALW